MRRSISAAVLIAALPAFHAAHAGAVEPVQESTRILVVGDSVTHGSAGDYTWRYFSWKGLEQTGAEVDFVGPSRTTSGGDGGYADPNFDQDHAARWGLSMWEMLDRGWHPNAPHVDDMVRTYHPDVVVETLGINDFTYFNFNAESMSDQVASFVAEIRSADPTVDVVLGTLPQTWANRHVAAFNEALPELAADLSTADSRVVATPVADFTEGVETYDNVHPSTEGQVKLAGAVSVALAELGVGRAITMPVPMTEPPATPTPTPEPQTTPQPLPEHTSTPVTTPTPELVPAPAQPAADAPDAPTNTRAVRKGATIVVTWKSSAGQAQVRCGHTTKTVTTSRAVLRSAAKSCKVRAIAATGTSGWSKAKVRR